MTIEVISFFVLAFVSIVSALLMITRPHPMHSAIALIVNFIALAGIYLTLSAQFIAIVQVVVYAGAIMVLVLFVIMLLNLQDEKHLREFLSWKGYAGLGLATFFLAELLYVLVTKSVPITAVASTQAKDIGTVEHIGTTLFSTFLFPFELTSMLLLAAIIGSVLLAKKRFP